MLKNKKILFISLIFALILLLPNISHAETPHTATSTTSTGVTVNWSYEVNENDEIVNLLCTNVSSITGTVEIPSTIDGKTVIQLGYNRNYGDGTFEECLGLTGVTIPNTVKIIGYRAFYGCKGLQNIIVPDTVTVIGGSAFSGCNGLSSVTLGSSLTTISSYAFMNTGLSSLVIPNNVISIETGAFESCKGLASITLPENLTVIREETFKDCSGLTEVIIPEHVTAIEGEYNYNGAFRNCKNLSKILIPDTVVSIGDTVFDGCTKLTIYGNEGKVSQRYAQENEINFKLISEWDESEAGDDITPPTVDSIEINSSSDFDYDSNAGLYYAPVGFNMTIYINFNEPIHGETVPTLTIKIGQGENIELNNGTISGSTIIYTYTIKEQDKGIISAVSWVGGDLKDAAGNEAEWDETLPEMTEDIWGRYVYANGTGGVDGGNNGNNGEPGEVNPDDGTPGDGTAGEVNPDEDKPGEVNPDDNNPNGGTGTNGEDKKDETQAPNPIPNAGKATLFSVFMVIILAGTVSFTKIRKYRQV